MSGRWQLCVAFTAGVALVSQLPVPPALHPAPSTPIPRAAVAGPALVVVVHTHRGGGDFDHARVQLVGVRGNTILPPVTVWEGKNSPLGYSSRFAANRYVVSDCGSVFDLYAGKVINDEGEGKFRYVDEKRLIYCRVDATRESGVFSFDFATGILTRLCDPPKMYGSTRFSPSPDGVNLLTTGVGCSEAIYLYRDGESAKLLGIFEMEVAFDPHRWDCESTPLLWLDEDCFLAQRGNGRLVTVDLDGRATELLTIPNVGKGGTELSRDGSGVIVYSCAAGRFKLDVRKKTATKTAWRGLGNGFEVSLKSDEKVGCRFRHNGKDIGQFRCEWYYARSAPGHLALPVYNERTAATGFQDLMVWSAATGEWTTVGKMRISPDMLVGWIK